MCECALLQVKFILCDLRNCPVRSWLQFGSDIYSDSAESLYSKIKAFVNDEPLNVNWDYLWNKIVYPNTGNTNQIIQIY